MTSTEVVARLAAIGCGVVDEGVALELFATVVYDLRATLYAVLSA